ncbi:hypothetical protein [Streptosporangium sp. NPDC087985]|uniref:hypothetical protein n=1 Tax=Streptosporangium sp. NPDC087985 TaxID=3366196 RepID=UPI0037F8AD2B
MTSVSHNLDAIRAAFPAWSMFCSDGGVFYASRSGEALTGLQIEAGLQRTVHAGDLPALVEILHDQEGLR